MSGLVGIIRDLIAKNGPLSVASFMDLALQHPEYGYYRARDPLGRSGDFTTAPEISQMFGEMIGLWFADTWRQMEKPSSFTLLELGPGRGTLMQDALRATAKLADFLQAMNLYLFESNETLRAQQKEKLSEAAPRWLDTLADLPPQPLFVIANEFFDALPIRQFEKNFQGWCERLVAVEDDKFAFTLWPLGPALVMLVPQHLREAVAGTVHEVSMASLTIMRDLTRHIVKHGGAMLVIDYGYVEASGKPTLQALSHHDYAPVLERPGEVDLTAHVDFAALRTAASAQNAAIHGPLGQGEFLKALGIDLRAIQLKQRSTPEQAKTIDVALHRLTDASQMGTLFKVIAITPPNFPTPAGF